MKKMEERIASMEQQLKTLRERHQKAEAKRKREETQQAKKDEARRKMLAGALVLEKVDRGEINEGQFRKWLDSALTLPEDRALFKL
jgi:large subunit ribosomal protein L7/L12